MEDVLDLGPIEAHAGDIFSVANGRSRGWSNNYYERTALTAGLLKPGLRPLARLDPADPPRDVPRHRAKYEDRI